MEHDFARDDVAGGGLKTDAHPAVAIVAALEGFGRDGIGEDEELGGGTAALAETAHEQLVFVIEHGDEAFARDVAGGLSVDGITESHVIGGHGFGDGAGGATGLKEHAGNLLTGPDLSEGPVFGVIQINRQSLAVGREQCGRRVHVCHWS